MCIVGIGSGSLCRVSLCFMLVVFMKWCGNMVSRLVVVMIWFVVKNWLIVSIMCCWCDSLVRVLFIKLNGWLEKFISRWCVL